MAKASAGRRKGQWGRLRAWFAARAKPAPELQRGIDLLKSIDAGGIPLNPAIVNRIARELGLEVSPGAPVEDTVARLRAAVRRGLDGLAMQAAEMQNRGAKQ